MMSKTWTARSGSRPEQGHPAPAGAWCGRVGSGGPGQIRLRRDFRDPAEVSGSINVVSGSINVVGTAGVATFDERDEIGVRAEEGTGPGVTAGQGENSGRKN